MNPHDTSTEQVAQVCAVVVVYHPDVAQLRCLLSAVLPQVCHLLVIDNGCNEQTRNFLQDWADCDCFQILRPPENVGLGAAHNLGISIAQEHECSHILLFDQDSTPSHDMVQRLLAGLETARNDGLNVAAVGPRLVDSRTNVSTPFVRFGVFGVKRLTCDGVTRPVRTDFLVSSGMLVPLSVLEKVGLLDETLFIDNVDMEWCFRARHLGFSVYGICDATMFHKVGDQLLRLGPYVVHIHMPIRQYYIARNRVLLYRRKYTPRGWIVQDALRMVCKFLIFATLIPMRRQNIYMMLMGFKDGILGNATKFPHR